MNIVLDTNVLVSALLPTDTAFVEVAAAAEASLITGNGRHFPPEGCAGITVLSPAAFLEDWQQQSNK